MHPKTRAPVWALVLGLLAAGTAGAKTRPDPDEQYKLLVVRGTLQLQRGRHAKGIKLLERAERIRPTAAVRCDLGHARLQHAWRRVSRDRHKRRTVRPDLLRARADFKACMTRARKEKSPRLENRGRVGLRDVAYLLRLLD